MNVPVKDRLEITLEKYGISQNRAAKDLGYSASAVSDYRNGKYPSDPGPLEDAIIKWCGRVEQAHARKTVPIVETDALKKILRAIEMAHDEQDIALIIGDAGSSKTTAAKRYAEQNPRTTVLIEVVSGMSRKTLIQTLAEQLGIDTKRTGEQTLVKHIAALLRDRDMVVILDEANYLAADALEFSRRLVHDLGQSGLVLIGLPALGAAIQNLRNDHRQLESRIGVLLPLPGLTLKDAGAIARALWPDVDREIVSAILAVSKTDVRQYTKILARMANLMALNKLAAPDLDVVEEAAKMLIRRNWR